MRKFRTTPLAISLPPQCGLLIIGIGVVPLPCLRNSLTCDAIGSANPGRFESSSTRCRKRSLSKIASRPSTLARIFRFATLSPSPKSPCFATKSET